MDTVKILLVDDSDVMLRHITGLLSRKGRFIIPVSDMTQALGAFERRKPDALLCDFVLEGGHTGLEAIQAIFALPSAKKGAPEGKRPAAAILTLGALSEEDQNKCAQMGVTVIQKPKQGMEKDFIQNVEFWLHDAGLLG